MQEGQPTAAALLAHGKGVYHVCVHYPQAKQYRANLHSHSTLSDGRLTPEQLVEAYREAGYSILAITDHEAPYDHTALSTPDLLLLTGYGRRST